MPESENDKEFTPTGKQNYLVWEGADLPVTETRHGYDTRPVANTVLTFNTVPFSVAASDENAACLSVMRKTRRVSVYAVCPVTMVDFTIALGEDEPEARRGQITSG